MTTLHSQESCHYLNLAHCQEMKTYARIWILKIISVV